MEEKEEEALIGQDIYRRVCAARKRRCIIADEGWSSRTELEYHALYTDDKSLISRHLPPQSQKRSGLHKVTSTALYTSKRSRLAPHMETSFIANLSQTFDIILYGLHVVTYHHMLLKSSELPLEQLWDQNRSILLPSIVILTSTITLVIFLFRQRNPTNFCQQESDKHRTNSTQPHRCHLPA